MSFLGDVRERVEEVLGEELEKLAPEDASARLQLYAMLFVVIDGSLQAEEQRVDVRFGLEKIRVYMRAAVPAPGAELDGRERVGTVFNVAVLCPQHEAPVVKRAMVLTHYAVSHGVKESACARYIFECPREETKPVVAPETES